MRKKLFLFSFRVPLLLTRPISSSLVDFQQGAFASKTFARTKKTPALQAEKFNLVPGARLDVRASLSPISLESKIATRVFPF